MSPPAPRCFNQLGRQSYPPIRSVPDALDVVCSVAAHPRRAETIALLMDGSRRGGNCLVVDGTVDPGAVTEVAEFVITTAIQHAASIDAVVLATIRPGRLAPDDDDHWLWFDLRDRFDEAGIDLLDWLIVSDFLAISLAQITDSRSLW